MKKWEKLTDEKQRAISDFPSSDEVLAYWKNIVDKKVKKIKIKGLPKPLTAHIEIRQRTEFESSQQAVCQFFYDQKEFKLTEHFKYTRLTNQANSRYQRTRTDLPGICCTLWFMTEQFEKYFSITYEPNYTDDEIINATPHIIVKKMIDRTLVYHELVINESFFDAKFNLNTMEAIITRMKHLDNAQ